MGFISLKAFVGEENGKINDLCEAGLVENDFSLYVIYH
jgi:hypothetical protein